jgi:hypothetical protein
MGVLTSARQTIRTMSRKRTNVDNLRKKINGVREPGKISCGVFARGGAPRF